MSVDTLYLVITVLSAVAIYYRLGEKEAHQDAKRQKERAEMHRARAAMLRQAYAQTCVDFDCMCDAWAESNAGWKRAQQEIIRLKHGA